MLWPVVIGLFLGLTIIILVPRIPLERYYVFFKHHFDIDIDSVDLEEQVCRQIVEICQEIADKKGFSAIDVVNLRMLLDLGEKRRFF